MKIRIATSPAKELRSIALPPQAATSLDGRLPLGSQRATSKEATMRIILLPLTLICTALLISAPDAARPAPPAVVRIATSGGDLSAEPLYAQSTGIFRRAGIDARIT